MEAVHDRLILLHETAVAARFVGTKGSVDPPVGVAVGVFVDSGV